MNSAIALGIQPLQIPDQAAGLQRALTLKALMGQGDLQGLQLQEAQRTLRQNQAMDEAALGSTSTSDYLARLSKINPGAAIKLKGDLLGTQKTQGEVEKQNHERAVQMAQSVLAADEASRPGVYKQLRGQVINAGDTGAQQHLPEEWDNRLIPGFQALATGALPPAQFQENTNYRALAGPQTPSGAALTDQTSGAITRPLNLAQPEGSPIAAALMNPQGPQFGSGVVQPWSTGTGVNLVQNRLPAETVTAKAPQITPDDYRKQASIARSKGTKQGFDAAKEYETAANQLESRILEEQKMNMDRFSAAPGAAGISFNKKTGEYSMNGRPISASDVQRIANEQARQSASIITQNTGPKAFVGKFGDLMAEQLGSEQKGAQKAADTIMTMNKMRGELDSGMYTGGFAERKLAITNMLGGLGIQIDPNSLANTQAFKSFVGTQLLQHAKDLGSNPSNADAVRIDKIIGNIENDPKALVKILDFNEEMGRRAVDRFNTHYQQVKKDPNAQFGFDITVPQPERYRRRATDQPQTNANGWKLHTDSKGNKAYVSPDGKQFEEVK